MIHPRQLAPCLLLGGVRQARHAPGSLGNRPYILLLSFLLPGACYLSVRRIPVSLDTVYPPVDIDLAAVE